MSREIFLNGLKQYGIEPNDVKHLNIEHLEILKGQLAKILEKGFELRDGILFYQVDGIDYQYDRENNILSWKINGKTYELNLFFNAIGPNGESKRWLDRIVNSIENNK